MAVTKSSFSPEQVALLAAGYDGTAPEEVRRAFVAEMAKKMNRQVRSIIGKISTMKASHNLDYVPYAAKAVKVRKATNQELVNTLAKLTKIDANILQSLERSSKAALIALVAYAEPSEGFTFLEDAIKEDESEAESEPDAEIAGDEVAID